MDPSTEDPPYQNADDDEVGDNMEDDLADPNSEDGPNADAEDYDREDDEGNDLSDPKEEYGLDDAGSDGGEAMRDGEEYGDDPIEEDVTGKNSQEEEYDNDVEAEEREDDALTMAMVRDWDPKQTADHLRQIGVDPKHCQELEDREITGDALLEMNQDSFLSQDLNLGVMGKRLKTSQKVWEFQREMNDNSSPDSSNEYPEQADIIADTEDQRSSLAKIFKHPFTWRERMGQKLQIQETRDLPPEELLDDLEPQWADQNPSFMEDLAGGDQSQKNVQLTHQRAKKRMKLVRDESGGIERATAAMCADLLDRFNQGRRLNKYRSR
jgi:hypothetical protein